ncbi:hypothetical protein K9N68_05890 [Kovacikia minuta CCNUW1]|uniref:hypothetical protein n=1 Tax=Kovacikia minuta TaxID=2931930 RepID=UPI001CCE71CA|nr:hypothetical protein [Kovacikia minuta]UBF27476.1 hypothetical protein K9N68_05890 [Kovacikia minuta CCNUW1]
MEFRLDEAELRELAQIEAETNCDISAGFDWGQSLGNYLSQATRTIDHGKLLEILRESLGNVLSQEELEDAANSIQAQLRNRVIEKFQSAKSA